MTLSNNNQTQAISPIPELGKLNKEKVLLGEKLFNDPILSANNTISCAFCHDLSNGGDDSRPVALGIHGQLGTVNTPTVFNSSLNFRQFWDGRSKTLKEQAFFPVKAENEMGSHWPELLVKLQKHKSYPQLFERVFESNKITVDRVTEAIAEFEKTLLTPNSRFDKWLKGDAQSLSKTELEGYKLFKDLGCVNCHQGQNIGGNMYQTLGHFGNYFEERGNIIQSDFGLYNLTKIEEDKFKFKVPSLRNIELTAPYFHDGQVPTLEKAVELMAFYQLGREISVLDRDKIVSFLKTLTGEYKALEK